MNTEKTALVTGALGGLGRALSLELGRAGYCVILLDRQIEPLEKLYDELLAAGAPEPAIYALNLEGATPKDYLQLAETVTQEFPSLDLIFHAAAAFPGLKPMIQVRPEDWLSVMQINLTGPLWLTQALQERLIEFKGKLVFTIDHLPRVTEAYWGAYGISKSALMGLKTMLASELEASEVKVYGLNPGPMRTALRAEAYVHEAPESLTRPETVAKKALEALILDSPETGFVLDLERE